MKLFIMGSFMILLLLFITIYVGKHLLSYQFLREKKKIRIFSIVIYIGFIILIAFTRNILLGIFIHLVIFYALTDLFGLLAKHLGDRVNSIWKRIYCNGILVVILTLSVSVYGYYNAKNMTVKDYDITLSKEFGKIDTLNILLASDFHLGTTVQKKDLDQFLEEVNREVPDIVCLDGDIYDESTSEDLFEYSYEIFSNLQTKYGVYYVAGNHEGYGVPMDEVVKGLNSAGVIVLQDEVTFVAESFYIIGRKDVGIERQGEARKELSELLRETDSKYPIIVLDHQPVGLKEASELGVDLQLSGHTHAGQIIPLSFFITAFNELGYGEKIINNYHILVTSGLGTWGFPIRTGSHSEIVRLKVSGIK